MDPLHQVIDFESEMSRNVGHGRGKDSIDRLDARQRTTGKLLARVSAYINAATETYQRLTCHVVPQSHPHTPEPSTHPEPSMHPKKRPYRSLASHHRNSQTSALTVLLKLACA